MRVEDVERAYRVKLGAYEERSGDHARWYASRGSTRHLLGYLSHSWKGHLHGYEISRLAANLQVTPKDFQSFVDCTLSGEAIMARTRPTRPTPTPKTRLSKPPSKPRKR